MSYWKLELPFLTWLREYDFRADFARDLIAGLSLTAIVIPQSMAYAEMAGLSPVFGLYSSIFPVIIYSFLGTSRHLSIGPFALTSLMVKKALSNIELNGTEHQAEYERLVMFFTLLVGINQFFLWLLRFGSFVKFINQDVVSGFTTAASIHIIASQFSNLLGIKISETTPQIFGLFYLIYQLFSKLPEASLLATSIGILSTLFLFGTRFLNKKYSSSMPVPFPDVVFLVFCMTLLAKFIPGLASIPLVGYVPTGLPKLILPIWNFPENFSASQGFLLFLNALIVALVSYTISVTVAQSFANRIRTYRVNENQEILVFALCNIVCSFLQCYLSCASLSRSSLLVTLNAKSPLASILSVILVIITLLWIASFFETLPKTVLSAIVIVALYGVFSQIFEVAKLRKSKRRLSQWLFSFATVILFDVTLGLILSLLFSLGLSVYHDHLFPFMYFVGKQSSTSEGGNVYERLQGPWIWGRKKIEPIPGVKIMRFTRIPNDDDEYDLQLIDSYFQGIQENSSEHDNVLILQFPIRIKKLPQSIIARWSSDSPNAAICISGIVMPNDGPVNYDTFEDDARELINNEHSGNESITFGHIPTFHSLDEAIAQVKK